MMVIGRTIHRSARAEDGLYCPHCLHRVAMDEARRQAHHEACRSGPLDVSLLRCPTCGLVLHAEVLHAEVLGADAGLALHGAR
jgi:hypothetical protein